MIVYCITNKVNGKQYIGMTSRTLQERWDSHCSAARNGSNFRFHCAIRKYGEESFDKHILFENLNIDECRTLEEQSIKEYQTLVKGYNAKPGGCGGWIVPDHKYDNWLLQVSKNSTLESNGRWSGYSDEFILDECAKIFNEYADKTQFSFKNILEKLRQKYDGVPKSFSKNRFKDYDGGFKAALAKKLNIELDELIKLSNAKSDLHIKSLANANSGNNWYSNDIEKVSIQSKTHPGDGWIQGRKYGNKN